ncbi:hypothetical protein R1sor_014679 [Riccia sorocarpa]|uniref:Uncharacterized protein n=1 Tax=Riccia sorocarpa TaxID=122646 RepID=A0ABD3HDW8_9MARC
MYVENRGVKLFHAWLARETVNTLIRLRENIVRKFSKEFGLLEEEIITQARLQDVLVCAELEAESDALSKQSIDE